jgi:predicted DNA-binding transcriptional regulator YafY
MVHILLNKNKVTAKELAEEFQVSTRTIYRDIDTLSMSGIPIYTDKGTGGGIGILDSYVLNKSLISEEEKNNIIMGLEVLQATNYDDVDRATRNLKNLFDKNADNYIEVDFSSFDNEKEGQIFEDIKTSIKRNSTLEILYKNNLGHKTNRKIDPLKLIFKKQRWYLMAYCHERKDYRTFRISRIKSSTLTNEMFNRKDYDISDKVLTSHGINNMKSVVLTLHGDAYFRVEEEFDSSMIVKEDDKLIVSFQSEFHSWLPFYIMSFADYIIDVEPLELKNIIKEKANKIINLI